MCTDAGKAATTHEAILSMLILEKVYIFVEALFER